MDIDEPSKQNTNNNNNNNNKPYTSNNINSTKLEIFLANMSYILSFFEKNKLDCVKTTSITEMNIQSYPKYLTNPHLFNLELNDTTFRNTIVLQFLIVLHSLLNPVSPFQKKTFIFDKETTTKINNLLNKCNELLKNNNELSYQIIQDEKIWEKWKETGCQKYDIIPSEYTTQAFSDNNNKDAMDIDEESKDKGKPNNNTNPSNKAGIPIFTVRNNLINKGFNFEKEVNVDLNDTFKIKQNFNLDRVYTEAPCIGCYFDKIVSDLDPTIDDEDKDNILKEDPSFSWKFLRLLSQSDLSKINIEDSAKNINMICEDIYKQYKNKDSNLELKFSVPEPVQPTPAANQPKVQPTQTNQQTSSTSNNPSSSTNTNNNNSNQNTTNNNNNTVGNTGEQNKGAPSIVIINKENQKQVLYNNKPVKSIKDKEVNPSNNGKDGNITKPKEKESGAANSNNNTNNINNNNSNNNTNNVQNNSTNNISNQSNFSSNNQKQVIRLPAKVKEKNYEDEKGQIKYSGSDSQGRNKTNNEYSNKERDNRNNRDNRDNNEHYLHRKRNNDRNEKNDRDGRNDRTDRRGLNSNNKKHGKY